MLAEFVIKEFNEIVNSAETQGWSLKDYREDTIKNGQTAFTYYYETSDLYDRYRADCEAWLDSLVEEKGLNPWEIFPDWDIYPDSEINKWLVVTSMFEEYCYFLFEK